MKNNLKEIQVFYRFLYRSYTKEDYYESVYYNLWQYYRTKIRDLYIGKYITYNDEKCLCIDFLSYNGSIVFSFKSPGDAASFSLNVSNLEGINFE
jgi:hypothetical protein